MEPALLELYSEGTPDDEVAVILRMADPLLPLDGVRVVARFGNIATVRVRRGNIPGVWSQTPVLSMKAAKLYGPTPTFDDSDPSALPEAAEDLEVRPSDLRRPEGDLPTGEGVLVAHIDWGLDFAHPDFRHPDGRTRLLALWDQSAPFDLAAPNRYGYGRIYNAAEIDRALAAADPYAALGYCLAPSDSGHGCHGTHCMGISAGNGRSGGPMGLAPEAGLIFVHFSTATAEGPSQLGDSVAFLEALDCFAQLAGDRPFVVNASLGRQAGQHDGKTLTEQGMDAFLLAADGRCLSQSFGNYFDRGIHATGILRPGQIRTLGLIVAGGGILPNEVDLWYPGIDRFGVILRAPEGGPEVRAEPGKRVQVTLHGRKVGNLYHRIGDPNNGDNEVTLFLDPTAPAGRWELILVGQDIANGRFHAWVERTASRARHHTRFDEEDDDPTSTLGTICNGFRTIAVGAYDAHSADRRLTHFTSSSPTRDGREVKPELVAPGMQVLSARSHPRAFEGEPPLLTRMSGTSMAAPHVTGTIALMFAAAGRPLAIDETRRLLLANTDPIPADAGRIDRLRLGGGYLNTAAAVAAARQVGQGARPTPALREVQEAADAAREADAVACGEESPEAAEAEGTEVVPEADAIACGEESPEAGEAEGAEVALEADGVACGEESPEMQETALAVAEGESSMNGQQDSIPSEDEAAELAELDDGSLSRVTWDGDPEAETLDAEDEMAQGEAAEAQRDERRWRRPGAPLPFQFQVPLTGGAPALAVPIGGPGSPIAATVPLGGAQLPAAPAAAPAAPAAAPAAPPGSPAAPPTTPYAAPPDAPAAAPPVPPAAPAYQPAPSGEPAPVAVAAADFPLYVPPEMADAVHEAMQVPEVWQELELRSEAAAPSFAEGSAAEAESEAEGAEWGERVLTAAARSGGAGGRPPSSSAVLRSLTEGAMESEAEADGGTSSGLLDTLGQMPSATALFNSLVDPDSAVRRRNRLSRFFGERFMVLARPGEPLGEIRLRPGDLLLRVAQGEGWGHVAILTSPRLYRREELADARLRGEGYPQLLPGQYVHVVEPGPRLRTESDRFARRLCNAADFVLPDTLLIRILPQTAEAVMPGGEAPGREPTAPSAGGRATLRKGDSGDAVRQAQRALNRIHADALALGLPGLPGCPLPEDGRFADSTEAAVTALQQQVLSDPSKWDGVIGPETWAQLTLLAGASEPAPPQPAAPQRQAASRRPRRAATRTAAAAEASGLAEDEPTASGAVAEGREVVATVPLLHGHVGTPPDLILRWNRMASVPQAVDVAIHLHGFSGRGAAMRLDADKEPRSGLDFANPDPPGEPGRTEPTLCVLPRGNYYGGRSGMGYDFPALITPEALRQLIDFALARFAARIGAAQVAMRRLLLTAHSGGGAPLMRILGHYDPDEVHVFDGLYSSAASLVRWVTARLARPDAASSALRVLYIAGTGTAAQSESVARALAGLLSGSADPRARRFRVEATRVVHNDIPRRFGWRLLLDAGSDLPLGSPPPSPHRRTPHHAAPHPSAPPPASPADSPTPAPSTPTSSTPAPATPTSPGPAAPAPAAPAHPAAGGLAQADVDRLGAITFGTAAEINAFFARGGAAGFADWFNATLGGRAPFVRLGGGGEMRMPIAAAARARFDAFWDRIPLAYDQPRISALEFAALMCITMNETDGDFASRAEGSGRNQGGRTDAHGHHRGLAYFFDRIELRPGRWKASYNRLSGGRTAGSLFDDEAYIRAHGTLGGAAQLARHGSEFGGAWLSEYYPQDSFSTDERATETEFIRQADFYKFRGRGVIQTTGRGGYAPFVRFVQGYSGGDAALLERQRRWSALSADDAASASTNDDWEAIFASPDTLARALAFHAGRASTDYRIMSRDAAVLADVPAPPSGRRRPAGRKGSVFYMGRRISGSYPYGAGEYRDRVFTLLRGIVSLAGGAAQPAPAPSEPAPPAPAPPSSTEPAPAPPQREPSRPAPPSHPSTPRRGAVPAPDDATMHAQWDAHPRVHGHFSNSFARYSELAPLYAAQGVGDAAEYLDTNMVRLTFFGRHQDGHRDLVAPLRQAEEAMAGQTVSPPITSFGCLVPRPIRGTTNRLSNHALGRAFDLNPTGNPRITQAVDYLVIAAATGADLHQLRRETDPTTLSRISRAFQDGFTEAWASSQTEPNILAALQNRSARERLNGYARHGICTLYVPLIQALIAAGLVWGGAWPSSKDFMHFELRR